jgi:predicted enzyme related to lactoylglutathione lyase
MHIERITFAVNDVKKMVAFYNTVFDAGLKTFPAFDNFEFASGKLGGLDLLMCPNEIARVDAQQNRHQFRFAVEDLARVIAAVREAGGESLGDIQMEGDAKLWSARDPEGNTIEFIQRV